MLICDNGVQFKSREFAKLMSEYKVRIKFTPHFHLRANPTERQNSTIKTMISIYVKDSHRTCDVQLAKLVCALRTAKQGTSELIPDSVIFRRPAMLYGLDYEIDRASTLQWITPRRYSTVKSYSWNRSNQLATWPSSS